MPLSKKRQAEYMKAYRDLNRRIERDKDRLVGCKNDIMWIDGVKIVSGVVQPIPNRPDGSHR